MVSAAAGASKEDDIQKMLKCATHLGTKNCDVLMEPYVFKRRVDGTFFCVTAVVLRRMVWPEWGVVAMRGGGCGGSGRCVSTWYGGMGWRRIAPDTSIDRAGDCSFGFWLLPRAGRGAGSPAKARGVGEQGRRYRCAVPQHVCRDVSSSGHADAVVLSRSRGM